MLTPDQLDEAAKRLCRMRGNREDGFSVEEARHQIRCVLEILDAIEYAKDLK